MESLTAEELDLLLQERARAMETYLKDLGAVRTDEGHQPGYHFPCAVRKELEDVMDIPSALFPSVKKKALDMGIPICICPGVGHYLSMDPAEIVTNPDFMTKQISAMLVSLHDYTMACGRTVSWNLLNQYERRYLGSNLLETARLLKATGNALPTSAHDTILTLTSGR